MRTIWTAEDTSFRGKYCKILRQFWRHSFPMTFHHICIKATLQSLAMLLFKITAICNTCKGKSTYCSPETWDPPPLVETGNENKLFWVNLTLANPPEPFFCFLQCSLLFSVNLDWTIDCVWTSGYFLPIMSARGAVMCNVRMQVHSWWFLRAQRKQ